MGAAAGKTQRGDAVATAVARFRAAARGRVPRLCPCCGHEGLFAAFGDPPRYDARCPRCGSLERHRLFRLWMDREAPFGPGHRVLHFAPEPQLGPAIRARVAAYETADLSPRRAPDHVVDICDTGLPGGVYDGIVCNHVLEHVDDARALAEIARLLVPGGLAVLTTPIVEGWAATYENPAVTAPEDRRLHFGQADHVRLYGRDLRDRIRRAGFLLSEFPAVEPDVRRHGLIRGETLFLARKPASSEDAA
jgi:SAM-dependent methyltransferase